MPTFLFFKNKSIVDKIRGADPSKLAELVRKHDTGKGPSGGFPGGGQTIGGAAAAASTGPSAGIQLPNSLEGVATENLLPLLVLIAYLVYVFWPN
ncbi:THIOREDOXIN-LIKE PROTEIN 1 [Ceraceosorus bombacis]|uniref:THIOREDOXIN-LIKE PROTEIN 1 n=1 Tax=Ceraceosorus bombacis TaxID=401625 RepID=A0A0P1BPW3_9BASI|nr:THIOREDOXIN-LIKE PROTEIN 1 [Ceraceosorus bombacis]